MSEPIFGWAQSGELMVGNPNAVTMQADFTKGPGGQAFTVQFGVQKAEGAAIRPWADITWICNGNQIRRRVSVGNGVSISGESEYVSVRVYDSLRVGVDPQAIAGTRYELSINVAPGTRPAQNQPPQWGPINYTDGGTGLLTPFDGIVTVAPVTTNKIALPPEVGALSFYASVNAGLVVIAPGELVIAQEGNGVTLRLNEVTPEGAFIPLAPGVTDIALINSSAGNVSVSVAFGIEG